MLRTFNIGIQNENLELAGIITKIEYKTKKFKKKTPTFKNKLKKYSNQKLYRSDIQRRKTTYASFLKIS